MSMTCTQCGQRSDWIGTESNWRSLDPDREQSAMHPMYACENCGNRQRIGR